MKLITYCNYNF